MPHIQSDGNGGFVMTKQVIAFILVIIAIITAVTPAVAYAVGVQNTVDSIIIDVNDVKFSLSGINPRITETEKNIAVMEEQYHNIKETLDRIENKLDRLLL